MRLRDYVKNKIYRYIYYEIVCDSKENKVCITLRKYAKDIDVTIGILRGGLKYLQAQGLIDIQSQRQDVLISIINTPINTPINTLANTTENDVTDTKQKNYVVALAETNTPTNTDNNTLSNTVNNSETVIRDTEKHETIDYKGVLKFFNQKMEHKAIPSISAITTKRRDAINARMKEYGKKAIAQVIINASESDYLNGKNVHNWTADFNWLFLPTNFPKVLEGNYANKHPQEEYKLIADAHGTIDQRNEYDRKVREQGYASLVSRLLNEGSNE